MLTHFLTSSSQLTSFGVSHTHTRVRGPSTTVLRTAQVLVDNVITVSKGHVSSSSSNPVQLIRETVISDQLNQNGYIGPGHAESCNL
ncbi:hypothetical protein ABKN59_002315 [Abortiporus biennis]